MGFMVTVTPGKFQRILFIIAFLLILVVAMSAQWIRKDLADEGATTGAKSEFYSLEPYSSSLPLPPMRIKGPKGEAFDLNNYAGQFVLLNLWATWCAPCISELPSLERLKDHYEGKGLTVFAVSVDANKNVEDLADFLKKHGLYTDRHHVALYHDFQADIQKTIPFNALPVTFLIDPEGRIIYQAKGPARWDSDRVIAFLDSVQKAKGY